MPTTAGDGLKDVWPVSCLDPDFEILAEVPSPLTISLTENGQGDFTAHIEAEETVTGAVFCMVATLDEMVAANGGGQSHMPYHVVLFLTRDTGDPFSLSAGESIDIQETFTVLPEWDYASMGVACWVQKSGGINPCTCGTPPYIDLPILRNVLQACYIDAGGTSVAEQPEARFALSTPAPNPFVTEARIAFSLPEQGHVTIALYDVAGRKVVGLVDETLPGGTHTTHWDGLDATGNDCAGGVYFVRMVGEDGLSRSEKLVKLQ